MNTHPCAPEQPDDSTPAQRPARPVQTGALPGGQPGQGVNTSSSAPGQSNTDAHVAQRERGQEGDS